MIIIVRLSQLYYSAVQLRDHWLFYLLNTAVKLIDILIGVL